VASATSFADQSCQSVCVPNHRGLLDGSTHVVVSVAQLVGQVLYLVRGPSYRVVDHRVSRGRSHALPSGDRDKIELVDVAVSDVLVDNRTGERILEASGRPGKDTGVDSLAGVDIHQLRGVLEPEAGECLLDLVDLGFADSFDLAFANTVSVEDDLVGVSSVGSLERFAGVGHSSAEGVGSLLAYVVLDNTGRPVGGCGVVHGGAEGQDGLLAESRRMEHVQPTDHGWFVHERQVVDGPRNSSELGAHLDQNLRDD